MITDLNGRILGHTNREYVGQYLQDEISKSIFTGETKIRILQENRGLIDVVTPVYANKKHIAWARVSLSEERITHELELIGRNGIAYTAIALIIGVLFA